MRLFSCDGINLLCGDSFSQENIVTLFCFCAGVQIKTQWSVLHPFVCLLEGREWTPLMILEPTTGRRVRTVCLWQVHDSPNAAERGRERGGNVVVKIAGYYKCFSTKSIHL